MGGRPSSGSGKRIEFKENADDLVYAELNYAKYRDFDAKLQKDDFIEFIVNEAEAMNGQKDHDLNECRTELSNLEGIIEHMNLDQ